MTLLSVAAFYLLVGSAAFWRRKIDPNQESPDFDYCFGVLFGAGVGMAVFSIPAILFPSPYWNIALLFFTGRAIYLVVKRLKPLYEN